MARRMEEVVSPTTSYHQRVVEAILVNVCGVQRSVFGGMASGCDTRREGAVLWDDCVSCGYNV